MLALLQLQQSSLSDHRIHLQRQAVEVREGQRQLLPSVRHLFHLASSVAEQQRG
jgi:hypothetical protein